MAEAAETLIKQTLDYQDHDIYRATITEDLLLDELSLVYSGVKSRSAESEIYGRSLSSLRKLGAFMIDKSTTEIIHSPEAEQVRVEFYTSVEEGFGTDMELGGGLEVRDFDVRPAISGKVMAKDLKTAVSAMTQDGLRCAIKTAKNDQHFLPQLTRSEWDHENALLVDKMVRGETEYNTRIVISPFPEEAAAKSGDEYWRNIGYVPHLKRGFVQLYHVTENGVVCGSLSFDRGDKQQLRNIFNKYGIKIPENEVTDNWLKYAITDTLSEENARALAVAIADQAGVVKIQNVTNTIDVTRKHRLLMDCVFNESYVHICESITRGYQTQSVIELVGQLANKSGNFNSRYATALHKMQTKQDEFTDDDSIVLHELLVYSTIEMMRALYLKEAESSLVSTNSTYDNSYLNVSYLQSMSVASFQEALSNFGAEGAKNGRTYSACGLSISAGKDNNDKNPQKTFGGADSNNISDSDPMDNTECEYSGTFCYCCPYDSDGTPLSSPVEVTARRNKDGVASCLRSGCGATLDKNGKGNKGRIYEKAMRLARLKSIPEKVAA